MRSACVPRSCVVLMAVVRGRLRPDREIFWFHLQPCLCLIVTSQYKHHCCRQVENTSQKLPSRQPDGGEINYNEEIQSLAVRKTFLKAIARLGRDRSEARELIRGNILSTLT